MGTGLAQEVCGFPGRSGKVKILIPNYGCGNLASISQMIQRSGGSADICAEPRALRSASKVILAGVGAFDHGMRCLQDGGWIDELNHAVVQRRVPILGICLGMQLMSRSSAEGDLPGLGWLDAAVHRFQFPSESGLKVPHMGWNTVEIVKETDLMLRQDEEQRFYFVHSYYVKCADRSDISVIARHGHDFTAGLQRDNIHGVQFHPEKSHRFGMAVMKRFVDLKC